MPEATGCHTFVVGTLSPALRTERQALLDLLETLDPQQWTTPSLCAGWTVQDLAAHAAFGQALKPHQMMGELVRARFGYNRMITQSALRWSGRGTEAILERLRRNVREEITPPGLPLVLSLVDATVHALDARRPLGRPRPVPTQAFLPVARFLLGAKWPFTIPLGGGPAQRIAGLRLVAEDVGWAHGAGPDVRGDAEAILLLLAGRAVGQDELEGEGVPELLRRIGPVATDG